MQAVTPIQCWQLHPPLPLEDCNPSEMASGDSAAAATHRPAIAVLQRNHDPKVLTAAGGGGEPAGLASPDCLVRPLDARLVIEKLVSGLDVAAHFPTAPQTAKLSSNSAIAHIASGTSTMDPSVGLQRAPATPSSPSSARQRARRGDRCSPMPTQKASRL